VPEKHVVAFKPGQIMQQGVESPGNANGDGAETAGAKVYAESPIAAE
jgi:hypothetical protein